MEGFDPHDRVNQKWEALAKSKEYLALLDRITEATRRGDLKGALYAADELNRFISRASGTLQR
jgi:hypothetical protein